VTLDFAQSALSVAQQFSAITGGMFGLDFYEKAQSFTTDFDPVAVASTLADRAPGGSALRALYDNGKKLSAAYEAVRTQGAGNAAAGAATGAIGGKLLVLVETNQTVKSAVDKASPLVAQ
jgi:hypothetical protein